MLVYLRDGSAQRQQHASVSQGRICLTSQQHASVSQGRICLTSHQHASVSQGRICPDKCTSCHTEIEIADQALYLTQSQCTELFVIVCSVSTHIYQCPCIPRRQLRTERESRTTLSAVVCYRVFCQYTHLPVSMHSETSVEDGEEITNHTFCSCLLSCVLSVHTFTSVHAFRDVS